MLRLVDNQCCSGHCSQQCACCDSDDNLVDPVCVMFAAPDWALLQGVFNESVGEHGQYDGCRQNDQPPANATSVTVPQFHVVDHERPVPQVQTVGMITDPSQSFI